jgi:hypothetical protein
MSGKDVDHSVSDTRQNDAFHVTILDGCGDLILEPVRELVVAEIANGNKGTI